MSIKLSARVRHPGEHESGVSLGIAYDYAEGHFAVLVLWEDGSLTAEDIEKIKVNVVDTALIYQELDELNKEMTEQYQRPGRAD